MKHHSETAGEYRKIRKQTGPGKGDKRRPTNDETFRKNFDEINWHHDRALDNEPGKSPGSCPEFA